MHVALHRNISAPVWVTDLVEKLLFFRPKSKYEYIVQPKTAATKNCCFLGRNRSTNISYAGSQSVNQNLNLNQLQVHSWKTICYSFFSPKVPHRGIAPPPLSEPWGHHTTLTSRPKISTVVTLLSDHPNGNTQLLNLGTVSFIHTKRRGVSVEWIKQRIYKSSHKSKTAMSNPFRFLLYWKYSLLYILGNMHICEYQQILRNVA